MVHTPDIYEEKEKHGAKTDRAEKGSRQIQNDSYLGYKRTGQNDHPTVLFGGYGAFHSRAAEYTCLQVSLED